MTKFLIIGANGFFGTNLLQIRNNEKIKKLGFNLFAADLNSSNIPPEVPFYNLDIVNGQKTKRIIKKINPDIVILTAAKSDVDGCETNKELATQINVNGTKNVLIACEKIKTKLFFLSTDFIFDGISKKGNYNEDDVPNPLNHYGFTKYQAEKVIYNSKIEFCICRAAVLYGWNPLKLNFITWILSKLEQNQKITVVTTQFNNPTFIVNLAQILLKLIEKGATDIYHTAGIESLNKYEMAIKCAEFFDFDKNLIIPVENVKQIAIRPKNVGLDISKLEKLISSELKIYNLYDGLNDMKQNKI